MDHSYLAYEIMNEFSRINFTKPKEAVRIISDSRNISGADREQIFKDARPFKVVDNWLAVKLAKAGKLQTYWDQGWKVLALYDTKPITLVKVKQKEGILEFLVRQHTTWHESCSPDIPKPETYQEFTQFLQSAERYGYDYKSMENFANKNHPSPIPLYYHPTECLMFWLAIPVNKHSDKQVKVEAEIYHGTPIEERKKTIGPYDRVTLITTISAKKPKQELTLPDKLF
jgi:hypothetical protein